MAKVTQADILGPVTEAAGIPGAGGGDPFKDITRLIDGANSFIDKMSKLAEKTGLPIIGDDAAIKRLLPAAPARQPARPVDPTPPAEPQPAPALSKGLPVAAPAPAISLADEAERLFARAEDWIAKNGLGGLTLADLIMIGKDRTVNDLLKAVRNALKS